MTFSTEDMTFDARPVQTACAAGAVVDETHWGYTICDGIAAGRVNRSVAAVGRFLGVILLMAALGLWVLPDAAHSPDLLTMKLAAMVMFTVVGGTLFWTGRAARDLEVQVDMLRGEVRIGHRGFRDGFRVSNLLRFDQVASVYLLRSKDRSQPTRMFLRLAGQDGAVEIARGPQASLEALRLRLTRDLARPARQPAERPIRRPGMVTA